MTIVDWLRLLAQVFYAPLRGMREVRDRGSLAPTGLAALLACGLLFFSFSLYIPNLIRPGSPFALVSVLFNAGSLLVLVAIFFSPLMLFLTNVMDRRGSIRLLFQQEYSPLTCTLFYALAASSLITAILTVVGKVTGVLDRLANNSIQLLLNNRAELQPEVLQVLEQGVDAGLVAVVFLVLALFIIFFFWSLFAVRLVLRLSWPKSLVVVIISGISMLFGLRVLPVLGAILASPFLLIMLFLLLRGFVSEIARNHRARESFRQNLEAATLNPADASAHYNLGLIHQQRGELDEARERFERAVQIDAEEIDAHYQLGRIARQQKRLSDAIAQFEQVVLRDDKHAQQEVWREVGATYVAAGQYADAIMPLETFLDRRPSDPEALYLLGRAHAGLGHRREAETSLRACIDAVKTAPAYKYRADKRWLNEAQQFIKTVSSQ